MDNLFTLNKLECFKQALLRPWILLAWDKQIKKQTGSDSSWAFLEGIKGDL
jgi:hypothetical protein